MNGQRVLPGLGAQNDAEAVQGAAQPPERREVGQPPADTPTAYTAAEQRRRAPAVHSLALLRAERLAGRDAGAWAAVRQRYDAR